MKIRCAATLAALALAPAAFAQVGSGGTITDGLTSYHLNDYTGNGTGSGATSNFSVGGSGNPDHMFANWWWYRVDGEQRETAFSDASSWSYAGNYARLDFESDRFDATMTYTVLGIDDAFGMLTQALSIRNTSNAPLTISLFNYTDLDAVGTAGGDSVDAIAPNILHVTDAAEAGWDINYEGTTAFAVGGWPSLRSRLTNAIADDFTGTGLPFGPGDMEGGFEWTVTIDPGYAFTASSTVTIVPAPGAAALGGLSLLSLARRRRSN